MDRNFDRSYLQLQSILSQEYQNDPSRGKPEK